MQVTRKINLFLINALRGGFAKPTERTFVGRVFGIVQSAPVEDGEYGPRHKLIGEFRAVNPKGEMFAAPVCLLPEGVTQGIVAGLKKSEGTQFAYDFFINPDADAPAKYRFEAVELIPLVAHDPLAQVLAALPELPKAAEKGKEGESAPESQPDSTVQNQGGDGAIDPAPAKKGKK